LGEAVSTRATNIKNTAKCYRQKLDPIADKVSVAAILLGGALGGYVEPAQAAAIMTTEIATAVISVRAEQQGLALDVPKIGKIGMVLRVAALAANVTSHIDSLGDETRGMVTYAGRALSIGAAFCGAASAISLQRQATNLR
jgi:phosphatidylglycerophosphate synthase